MIGSDAPRVHIAASSAIVVGLAALAFKVSQPAPWSPPPEEDLPVSSYDDTRLQAIAYAENAVFCIDHDCAADLVYELGLSYVREPIDDPKAPLAITVSAEVVGELDDALVERRVEHAAGQLRACYEYFIGPGGPLGTVTALIANDAAGAHHRDWSDGPFTTEATGITEELARCVATTVGAIEFPPVESPVVATVQITFARTRAPLTDAEELRCDFIRELPPSVQIDFDPPFFKRCGPAPHPVASHYGPYWCTSGR